MNTTKTPVEIDIRQHWCSTPGRPVWLVIVTTNRGLRYYITYAGDRPDENTILEVWIKERNAFEPYS